jgi:hypothetical protein
MLLQPFLGMQETSCHEGIRLRNQRGVRYLGKYHPSLIPFFQRPGHKMGYNHARYNSHTNQDLSYTPAEEYISEIHR